jgi:hypothetical protein
MERLNWYPPLIRTRTASLLKLLEALPLFFFASILSPSFSRSHYHSTALPLYRVASLPLYCVTALPRYHSTCYRSTTLLLYSVTTTTLLLYRVTALRISAFSLVRFFAFLAYFYL